MISESCKILPISSNLTAKFWKSLSGKKFKRSEIKTSVSTSLAEPCAIDRKLINSLVDFRPAPSAILAAIDTAARRICDVKPNLSSLGNRSVNLYTSTTKSIAFFQTSKFWCGRIYLIFLSSHLFTIYDLLFHRHDIQQRAVFRVQIIADGFFYLVAGDRQEFVELGVDERRFAVVERMFGDLLGSEQR
jgi:hypothetical protein